MKQIRAGIDIIEINRVREAIAAWGERFLRRIYTDLELENYRGDLHSLAARFAGKEAVIKALSTPGASIRWQEIEILSETGGRPLVRLHGRAQAQARMLGIQALEISLSHSKENAIALVIGTGEG